MQPIKIDRPIQGADLAIPRIHETTIENWLLSGVTDKVPDNLKDLIAHDRGDPFWLAGMLQTIKVDAAATNGDWGLLEICVPQGCGSPVHMHFNEDETFYCLEGELTVWVDDSHLVLKPGQFAFGIHGVKHSFYAASPGGAKGLAGFRRMEFEGFLREGALPAPERVLPPPDEGWSQALMNKLSPIGLRNGFEILGPPGPPPWPGLS